MQREDAYIYYTKHRFKWTPERIAVLSRLWREGLSATEIAEKISGISRSAVLGKLHRLGLDESDRRTGSANSASKNRRKPRRRLPDKVRQSLYGSLATRGGTKSGSSGGFRAFVQASVEPLPEPKAGDVARVASVLDLEEHHCRFPVSSGLCGDTKVSGLPYCEAHAKRCYRGTVSSPNEFRLADFKARPKVLA